MSNQTAVRDDNQIATAMLQSESGEVRRALLDTSTGYWLMDITNTTTTSPTGTYTRLDDNREYIVYGQDATTGELRPVLIDNRTGYVFFDLELT